MNTQARILVVEDDPQIAEILEWSLRPAGYSPTVVVDGLSAMRAFDHAPPDLVTIDLNVPEVSGFRLVQIFKRYAPTVPVIVVTALSFEEAEEIARAGADDFVTKPFDPAQLVHKIRYHLERRASPRPTAPSPTSPDPRRDPVGVA